MGHAHLAATQSSISTASLNESDEAVEMLDCVAVR